jgi:hypothetical protein
VCKWRLIRADLDATISSELLDALDLLHSLPQTQPSESSSSVDVLRNARKLFTLETKLTSIATGHDQYEALLRCAAHLYTSRALRNLPKASVLVSQLESKLVFRLSRMQNVAQLRKMSFTRLLLMLWALLLGQQTHDDKLGDECDSHIIYIMWLLERLRITDYDILLDRLKCIAWVDGFREAQLRELFD